MNEFSVDDIVTILVDYPDGVVDTRVLNKVGIVNKVRVNNTTRQIDIQVGTFHDSEGFWYSPDQLRFATEHEAKFELANCIRRS